MNNGNAVNGNGMELVQDTKRVKLSSVFSLVEPVPLSEVFRMKELYLADESRDKVNLSVGGELPTYVEDV